MTSLTGNRGPTGKFSQAMSSGQIKEKLPPGTKAGQIQQFTPEQMQLFQQLFSHVGPESYLSQLAGGDEAAFQQMEAPALRDFAQLQGGLASRFSGMGGLGGRKSSGFQNTANQYASNFAQDLQSRRQALQRQAIMDLMGLSGQLLGQRPFERTLSPKQEKSGGWGGPIGAAIGGTGGFFAGGPAGAVSGAQLGYKLGSGFDKGGGGGAGGGGGGGGFGGMDLSGFGNFFGGGGGAGGGGQSPLGTGYDQEFRMNPAAMGF